MISEKVVKCEGCHLDFKKSETHLYELYEGTEMNLQFVGMIRFCKDCAESSSMCLVPFP